MIGLFFVGVLFVFVTKEAVAKHLGKKSIGSLIKAALFGVPLPLCSCGVVPTSVYLARNGATKSSVISFLTSTPQTGVDSIIATYGMMGPIYAIFRPISALLMGVLSGLAIHNIKDDKEIANYNDVDESHHDIEYENAGKSILHKTKNAIKYSFVEFLDDIAPQFLVGLVIAALITYFVPDDFFADSIFRDGIWGMLLMIAIGAPMYICATSSIPIAISLMLKGFSPGVAFVFLTMGPATNAASFAILMKVLGKKISIAYLLILAILSIAFGYLLDFTFKVLNADPMEHLVMSHCDSHSEISITNYIFGSIFFILIAASIYRLYIKKYFNKNKKDNSMLTIQVKGMNCNHCVRNVTNAINTIEGIKSVEVDLTTETAVIDGDVDANEVKKRIEEAGYSVNM